MNKEQRMVRDFHHKFGFTVNDKPTLIDDELSSVRFEHTLAEMDELENAMSLDDLEGVADALGDILYFIYGTAVAYGIDMEPVFNEIHKSNMSKERPSSTVYVDAKAVKGKDYKPPNILKILVEQNMGMNG